MIYLITGQPGHGKTLRAVELAVQFVEQGREVYAHGIRGLDYAKAGFHELADPTAWESLPDKAVIVLDECYTAFPQRSGASKVPAHVQAMATHRHRGFDFILIAQQASKQIDGFLLGLVERHEHVRRRYGRKVSIILWWDKFSTNLTRSDTKKLWAFPKKIMERNLYESTVEDTTQRKLPWFYYAIPVLLLCLGLAVWRIMAFFSPDAPAGPAAVSSSVPGALLSGSPLQAKRPDDLASFMRPRLAGQPWTAAAFDTRPIVSNPEIYCIAVEDGGCSCITEQGTKHVVEPKICRSIARDGVYNPTRQPRIDAPVPQPVAESRPVLGTVSAGVGESWPAGVGQPVYVPPASPGSWSPESGSSLH
jgi:hypothetical protein